MTKSLAERLVEKSKNPFAFVAKDDLNHVRDWIDTGNVTLNCQISADPFRGIASGRIYQYAGPESTGKTYLTIEAIKSAQAAGYTIIYYDTEGAQNKEEFEKRGLDPANIVHSPIATIRGLHNDLLNLLDEVSLKDRVFIVIDSIGMLGSLKEIADAKSGSEKADFTRPKELRSFFRTITVPCAMKQVPVIAVNHSYDDPSSMYGAKIVGGGGGSKYASSVILTMTKSQNKIGTEVVGSFATITAIKNRMARERTKIKIEFNYSRGMSRWSGLFDVAMECGFITSPAKSWYCIQDDQEHKFRRKDVEESDDFWTESLENGFTEYLKQHFAYQGHAAGIIDPTDDEWTDLSDDNEEGSKD